MILLIFIVALFVQDIKTTPVTCDEAVMLQPYEVLK